MNTCEMTAKRYEDMSVGGSLSIYKEEDGDLTVTVVNSEGLRATVQFCSVGAGGGQSPSVLTALRNLFDAIEQDNANRPQNR